MNYKMIFLMLILMLTFQVKNIQADDYKAYAPQYNQGSLMSDENSGGIYTNYQNNSEYERFNHHYHYSSKSSLESESNFSNNHGRHHSKSYTKRSSYLEKQGNAQTSINNYK